MDNRPISTQTLRRLPIYLRHLKGLDTRSVSSAAIAGALDFSEIQVRKDLASISDGGRPGVGYLTEGLIMDIERYLGYDEKVSAVLVGAGNLGRAIMNYEGFARCGLDIRAAFDMNRPPVGARIGQTPVLPIEELKSLCRKESVRLGIITVPDHAAQQVCDMLAESGVGAIWNFAPVHLNVSQDIVVQNENLVASLTVLTRRLAERLEQK